MLVGGGRGDGKDLGALEGVVGLEVLVGPVQCCHDDYVVEQIQVRVRRLQYHAVRAQLG